MVCAAVTASIVSKNGEAEPLAQDVLASVPHTAYKVAVAPGGEVWWKSLSSMLPADTELSTLDIAQAGVDVQALGYAEYPGEEVAGGAPARVLVIDTYSSEDAESAARWLDSQPGAQSRNGLVQGTVLTVTDSTHVPAEDPEGFSRESFEPAAGQGTMWVDLAKDFAHAQNGTVASQMMPDLLGYSQDAQSILTSADGKLWKGPWVSGGFDGERVKFDDVQKVLDAAQQREVITDTESSGASTAPSLNLVTGGSTDILPAFSASDHAQGLGLGLLDTEAMPVDRSVSAQGDITAVFDRRALNAHLFGEEWRAEANAFVAYGLSGDGVEVVFY